MQIHIIKEQSLQDVAMSNPPRSFHIGNLTARDLLPVMMWCTGNPIDLNMVSDKSYAPTKIVYDQRSYDLYTWPINEKNLIIWCNSKDIKIPAISDTHIRNVIVDAQENSVSLGGFWMNINRDLWIWDFQTYTEKFSAHADVVAKVLAKIHAELIDTQQIEFLVDLRWRYVTPAGNVASYIETKGHTFRYIDNVWKTYEVPVENLWDEYLALLQQVAILHGSIDAWADASLLWNIVGPIPHVAITMLLDALIDIRHLKAWTNMHLWWQAMSGYTKDKKFLALREKLCKCLDNDDDLTNGIQREGVNIFPIHMYRHREFTEVSMDWLQSALMRLDTLADIRNDLSALAQQWLRKWTEEFDAKMLQRQQIEASFSQDLCNLKTELLSIMPAETLKSWALNEVYRSQLDLYALISKMGWVDEVRKIVQKYTAMTPQQLQWLQKRLLKSKVVS